MFLRRNNLSHVPSDTHQRFSSIYRELPWQCPCRDRCLLGCYRTLRRTPSRLPAQRSKRPQLRHGVCTQGLRKRKATRYCAVLDGTHLRLHSSKRALGHGPHALLYLRRSGSERPTHTKGHATCQLGEDVPPRDATCGARLRRILEKGDGPLSDHLSTFLGPCVPADEMGTARQGPEEDDTQKADEQRGRLSSRDFVCGRINPAIRSSNVHHLMTSCQTVATGDGDSLWVRPE